MILTCINLMAGIVNHMESTSGFADVHLGTQLDYLHTRLHVRCLRHHCKCPIHDSIGGEMGPLWRPIWREVPSHALMMVMGKVPEFKQDSE